MFKRILFVMMLSISVASAGGLGQIFDGGADLIRNLLKKMDFDGKYLDEFASTFDEAARALKKTDGEDFLTAMKRSFNGDDEILSIIGKDSDDIKYDDIKKLFDKVITKSNVPVAPGIRNMASWRPVGDIAATKTWVTTNTRRGPGKLVGFDVRKVSDDFVQKFSRALDMAKRGTPDEKRFWRAWKSFSEGDVHGNGYWSFLVDSDKRDLNALSEVLERITKENPGDDAASAVRRMDKLNEALEDAAKRAKDRGDDSLEAAYQKWVRECAGTKCIQ